jgi:hypothetical protein
VRHWINIINSELWNNILFHVFIATTLSEYETISTNIYYSLTQGQGAMSILCAIRVSAPVFLSE